MNAKTKVTLYHAPSTRSTGALITEQPALTWTTLFKLVPELPVIQSFIARVNERPAMIRGRAKDAELKATLG
jgi:hypothetical protein